HRQFRPLAPRPQQPPRPARRPRPAAAFLTNAHPARPSSAPRHAPTIPRYGWESPPIPPRPRGYHRRVFQTSAAQTLALSLGLGSLVLLISYRLPIPALLPLLITGLALGRSRLGLIDASTLGHASTGGRGLQALTTVSISLLIFEGSLHLDRTTLSNAPKAVWRVLTVGALVTWVGATLLARAVLDMSWHLSVTLGAILIVT